MVELVGEILKINPKLVTIKSEATTVELPIKEPTIYIILLKLRQRFPHTRLADVKLITDDEKGYVIDVQVKKEREWVSLLERWGKKEVERK